MAYYGDQDIGNTLMGGGDTPGMTQRRIPPHLLRNMLLRRRLSNMRDGQGGDVPGTLPPGVGGGIVLGIINGGLPGGTTPGAGRLGNIIGAIRNIRENGGLGSNTIPQQGGLLGNLPGGITPGAGRLGNIIGAIRNIRENGGLGSNTIPQQGGLLGNLPGGGLPPGLPNINPGMIANILPGGGLPPGVNLQGVLGNIGGRR